MTKELFAVVCASSLLSGCGIQSEPRMPRAVFAEAAGLCGLNRTTYTPTHSWLLDSAMIDFRAESDPEAAHRCFNARLITADQVLSVNGKMPEHIGYVWDTQT